MLFIHGLFPFSCSLSCDYGVSFMMTDKICYRVYSYCDFLIKSSNLFICHIRVSTSLRPTSSKQMEIVPDESPALKLPDASFLLNSPVVPSNQLNSSDHSSRVAAAMAESAARKRDLKGSAASHPRSKVPKGALPHSKSVPETVSGRLLPPQLSGRCVLLTYFCCLCRNGRVINWCH